MYGGRVTVVRGELSVIESIGAQGADSIAQAGRASLEGVEKHYIAPMKGERLIYTVSAFFLNWTLIWVIQFCPARADFDELTQLLAYRGERWKTSKTFVNFNMQNLQRLVYLSWSKVLHGINIAVL